MNLVGDTVIVLAKAPVPGLTKTRLCPPCTPFAAARLAEAALLDTADVVTRWGGSRLLSLDRCGTSFGIDGWTTVDQCDGDLAARLDHTFSAVFSNRDGASRAFLIAMDTPQLTPAHLSGAFSALDGADVVVGPAADGGYWGIGCNQYLPGLFDEVPMSTAHTFDAQLARALALGQRVSVLDVVRDIDGIDDAIDIGRSLPGTRVGELVSSSEWWRQTA